MHLGRNKARHCCLSSFQQLRRLEEADSRGVVFCISCGRPMKWTEAQGGHYIPRTCVATEMESDNVFPQCLYCNCMLEGNNENYRRRLAGLIGESRVERLENMRDAWKGDDEALASLSAEDRLKVSMKRSSAFYTEENNRLRLEIKRLRRKKSI